MNADKCQDGYFAGHDGTDLYFRLYYPGKSKDTLYILHGHGEHSGRYQNLIEFLGDQDITVAIHDHRGHGKSKGEDVFVNSFDDFTKDYSAFRDFLETKYQLRQSAYILGHSLGGLIATHWSLKHQDKVKSLFLSSPCLGLNLPGFLVSFNNAMNALFPRLIYGNPIYPPHLTHDEEEMKAYKQDPLIKRKISARLLQQMISAINILKSQSSRSVSFPLFILMAGLEKVVSKDSIHHFFKNTDSPHKELYEFDGYYHEIFQEKGKEKVYNVFGEYLDKASQINSSA